MQLSVETCLKVGARSSPLSSKQVIEVLEEIRAVRPDIEFEIIPVETTGDLDQKSSLRGLDKTDFFTKEIDELLLKQECRIAIHSAKDLPYPLPNGIAIAAITKGVSSSDSLVLREGEILTSGMTIATSSERREQAISKICHDLKFSDIRGTIHQRLEKLETGEIDGVVVAEAALIRLGLTHLNRLTIPGETADLQGKLAVLTLNDDNEMKNLFSSIDTRKKCLYLGMACPSSPHGTLYTHYPVITTIPLDPASPNIANCYKELKNYTHIIFTSKNAVRNFFLFLNHFPSPIDHIKMIAVGTKTAFELNKYGTYDPLVSKEETAEGVTQLIDSLETKDPYFFWPHSALSRTIISSFLKARNFRFKECTLYNTKTFQPRPPPNLNEFDSIYFTSPSTVKAFKQIFGSLPKDKELKSIGPITKETIELYCSLQ